MAQNDTPRSYTSDEHLAILADRVVQETASLTSQLETKDAEIASLVAAGEVKDAEIAKVTAELEGVRAELAAHAEAVAKEELGKERVEAARAACPQVPAEFFTAERAKNYGGLETAAWDAVLEALKAAPAAPAGGGREVAAAGGQLGGDVDEPKPVSNPTVFGGNFNV